MSNPSPTNKQKDDSSSSFSNPKSWLISQILKSNVSSTQGKDVKKQGILKTALVNSIAFKVAQTISPPKDIKAKENAVVRVKDSVINIQNNDTTEADENEKYIARIASKALAEFIIRGKNGHVNQVSTTRDNNNDGSKNVDTPKQPQIDMTSSRKYEIDTSGGTLHTLVLNLIERQRDWYIGGIDSSRSKPQQTAPNNKTKGEKSMDVTTFDIPLYPQLLKLTTNFIPSPSMFDSLKPLVLWAPFNVLIQPTSTAIVSSLPLTQQLIDRSMKSNLIWVLTDHEWRSWMKDSTSGYIEQSAPSNNNNMNTTSKENVGNI